MTQTISIAYDNLPRRDLGLRRTLTQGREAGPRSLSERTSGLTLLLAGVDIVALIVTCVVLVPLPPRWALMLAVLVVACRTSARLYRRRLRLAYFDDLPRSLSATCAALGATIAVIMLAGNADTSIDILRAALIFLLVSEPSRILVFAAARTARKRLRRGDRTVVVGTDEVATELMCNMLAHPEFGLRPVGFVDESVKLPVGELPAPLLPHDLATTIVEERIGTVVVAQPTSGESRKVDQSITALRMGCMTLVLPRMHELYHDDVNVERLRSYPLVRLNPDPTRRPAWIMKRVLDVAFALVVSLLLLPVMAACAIAVLIESGRPIFFGQVRVGLNGRHFTIYKFRSMKPANEAESATTWSIVGDPRIGPVGRFLRASSLDELPQLWNMLRGEMTLVGPRPERPGFVEKFSADHERYWARHRVPPGLTGLAQINGLRGNTSIADRVRYDNYYIANWSLWLDAKIVPLTLREVLRREAR